MVWRQTKSYSPSLSSNDTATTEIYTLSLHDALPISWHFYDGDMHSVFLLRDNQTVAGEQGIVRDHDLIERTHSKGILFPDTWWSEPEMCSMYFFEGPVAGERSGKSDTTMNMILRPGEAITWRWGQLRPLKYHGMLQVTPTYEDTIYT